MTTIEYGNFCVICDPTNTEDTYELDCTLLCGHRFHYDCIHTWLTNRISTCPVCRKSVNSLTYTRNENGTRKEYKAHVKTKRYVEDESDILYVVQYMSDSEEDLDDVLCNICLEDDGRDAALMLCSTRGCPSAAHFDCLDPPLPSVPEGDWFCPACENILSESDQSMAESDLTRIMPSESRSHAEGSSQSEIGLLRADSRVSALERITLNNEEIFAPIHDTLIRPYEKLNHNRVILDSPEKASPDLRAPKIERSTWSHNRRQPAYTTWKSVVPSSTPAPRIDNDRQRNTPTFPSTEGFSDFVQSNKATLPSHLGTSSFHATLNLSRYTSDLHHLASTRTTSMYSVTPARSIERTMGLVPVVSRQTSAHPKFPVHRSLNEASTSPNQARLPQRKRLNETYNEPMSQRNASDEITQTLKSLARSKRITPQEAVLIQRNVEKAIETGKPSVTNIHHLIDKHLNEVSKNRNGRS